MRKQAKKQATKTKDRERRDATRKPARSTKPSSIVSPRDERGTPYPGDVPNPLRGRIRDCF